MCGMAGALQLKPTWPLLPFKFKIAFSGQRAPNGDLLQENWDPGKMVFALALSVAFLPTWAPKWQLAGYANSAIRPLRNCATIGPNGPVEVSG
jgi:hypothetical protein